MRRSNGERYRRSPSLVCYWQGRRLVLENFATGDRITADPLACELLGFFQHWRPLEALFSRFPQFTAVSLRRAVRQLLRHSVLQSSERPLHPAEKAMEAWQDWNPAAGFFHFSTKDLRYQTDMFAADRYLERKSKQTPPPGPVKRYSRAPQRALPPPRSEGEFPRVLLDRRTWRQFSPRSLKLLDLATLLGLTWGVQWWLTSDGVGRLALKTSPSGGALHPIEVYVLALNVGGLPRGLYHYSPDRHRLELLRRGGNSSTMVRYLGEQWWFRSAAALTLMTAVFPRSQWKYQHPRAYRAVLLDAGHLCQTFCLVATWLGLAPFCTMALADSVIEKALGIDGVTESVLYAAGVGGRPAGVDWAPWPSPREERR